MVLADPGLIGARGNGPLWNCPHVVLGMVQADRHLVSDFMRSDGSLHRALVARPEARAVHRVAPSRTDDCDSISARKSGEAVADR